MSNGNHFNPFPCHLIQIIFAYTNKILIYYLKSHFQGGKRFEKSKKVKMANGFISSIQIKIRRKMAKKYKNFDICSNRKKPNFEKISRKIRNFRSEHIIISISTVCITEGIINSKSAEVFNLQVFWVFSCTQNGRGISMGEIEGTLKIFVYFGTYYDRSIIMIGFVNISKAANELGDLMNFLGKNLDRLQIYNGRWGVEISSDVLWLA